MEENSEYKTVRVKLDRSLYLYLIQNYGVKGISKAINQILREYLFRSDESKSESEQSKPKSKLEELRERVRRSKRKSAGIGRESFKS